MSNRTWTDEQFKEAVKTSKTLKEVCEKIGLANYGANSKTIKKYINKLELNIDHFLTRKEINTIARQNITKLTLKELLSINAIDRKHIKNAIIKNNLIPYECKECHLSEWLSKPLSLHLDHINGDNKDNRLENLRFLCPNCHSQTETYCGRQLRGRSGETRTLDGFPTG